MSKNQLIALGAIAGVLVIVFLVKKAGESTPDLERELGLAALAPEGFLASDVSRVEMFRGSKKAEKDTKDKEDEGEEKVVLVKDEDGWAVQSAYNAPGKKDKIDEFLKKLKGLEGAYRSADASVLADYELADDEALHLVAYKEGEEGAWFHLLVGKKEAYGFSFVRRDGENDVYTVNVNLASEVGMGGDDSDKAPESSHWVDKTVVDLDKDKIRRIAISTPDRSFAFEKRPKAKEEKEEKKEKEEEEPELEWVLAEGGPGVEFKPSGVDDVLRALDSFEASDIVDPAKKQEFGLNAPGFRCRVKVEGGKETVLVASCEKPGEDAYMMVEGKDVVFKVADWKFDDVFPEAKQLFELKGLDEDQDKIERITLVYPSTKIELAREEDKWTISSPRTGLEFKEREAKDVARDLAEWKPADYAEGEDLKAYGLAEPERKVTFVVKQKGEEPGKEEGKEEGEEEGKEEAKEEGKEHTISIGAEARCVEGRYALLDGDKRVWVVGKWDFENIMPKVKDFFEMDVADVEGDDITKVVIERDGASLALERGEEDKWKLTANGTELEPEKDKVDDYLDRFSPLTASDIDLGGASWTGQPSVTVKVEAKDEKGFVIRFGPEKDGDRPARIEGKEATLVFPSSKAEDLAPKLKEFIDLTVADVLAGDITKVVVERDEDPFELVKEGGKWKVSLGGEEKDCDAEAVWRYLGAFSGLEAADVSVRLSDLVPEGAKPVVTITREGESPLSLIVGQEHEGRIALRDKDRPLVFLVDQGKVSSLTPRAADLAGAAARLPVASSPQAAEPSSPKSEEEAKEKGKEEKQQEKDQEQEEKAKGKE